MGSDKVIDAIEGLTARRARLNEIEKSVRTGDDLIPGFTRLLHWKERTIRFLLENVSQAEADNLARCGSSTPKINWGLFFSDVKLYNAILIAIIEALEDDPDSVFQPTSLPASLSLKSSAVRVRYKYDVFISYSSLDQEQATEIYDAIKRVDKNAFLSAKHLLPGQDFAEEIRKQLVASRELWLIVSPNSLKSEWVLTEWGAAWALNRKIIPILYRCKPDDLPERLRRLQSIDFHRHTELIANTFGAPKN
jgi:hypothetical protein